MVWKLLTLLEILLFIQLFSNFIQNLKPISLYFEVLPSSSPPRKTLSFPPFLISSLFQIFIGPIPTFVHEKYAHQIYIYITFFDNEGFPNSPNPGQLSRHCSRHNSISRKIGSSQLGELGFATIRSMPRE